MKTRKKRILVAPLDWGLGHASRCIPIIEAIKKQGEQVVIAADRRPLKLLREAFPKIEYVRLPGMEVSYPKRLPMSLYMLLKTPSFIASIKEEGKVLEKIVRNYEIDGIISDNRYGVHHPDIPSVLISHQLYIQAPVISSALQKLTAHYLKKFDHCWVPDFAGSENLSGKLSHQEQQLNNVEFIGPLSRFETTKRIKRQSSIRKVIAVISGPEPARTEFERLLKQELQKIDVSALIVRGLVGANAHNADFQNGKLEYRSHLSRADMEREILNSEIVICRSGYSSIMDLVALNKKAILVPTPGQTEQEYLAESLKEKGWFFSQSQKNLDLEKAMNKVGDFEPKLFLGKQNLLETQITKFLADC